MQDPNALRKRYERITNLLRKSRKLVPVAAITGPEARTDITRPGRTEFGQDEYEKFMGVGEYEYAWLALNSTAEVHPPGAEFWPQMAEAAVLLIANARTPVFQRKVHDAIVDSPTLRAAFNALPAKITDERERAATTALLRTLEGI